MSVPSPTSVQARTAPPTAWVLRAARPPDAEAWSRLQATIYAEGRAFVGDGPPTPGALAARLRSLRVRDGAVTLAVARPSGAGHGAGEIVGWVEAYRTSAQRMAHVALLTIAVAPAWRRHGIGLALMEAIAHWARGQRVRKLQLHVRAGNEGAIALYRRLGYQVEGVLRDQVALDDGYEDEWIMALMVEAT
jgi:ribosomal protein S18 acetylase RimI-like enzyme